MLKLFSWLPSSSSQFQSRITYFPKSFSFSRFLTHPISSPEEQEDFDDPPFPPVSKTLIKPHKKKDKIQEQKKGSSNNSGSNDFPVRSDYFPFDFKYSYSEIPDFVDPIGFRETPKFSSFGPGRLDRKWTGTCAPVPQEESVDLEKVIEERKAVLGDPLMEEEIAEIVEKYRHSNCSRQINLVFVTKFPMGKEGVNHNMLEDIHNHWKRAEAVRIKCLGVPTIDMDNVCFHLEDKSGGKIIYHHLNIVLIYRGRNYDPKNRPVIPLMLWKPYAPIYPKLVKHVADGLTFEETKEKRNKGLNTTPLMKLTRNGVYVNVVERVRAPFEIEEVV